MQGSQSQRKSLRGLEGEAARVTCSKPFRLKRLYQLKSGVCASIPKVTKVSILRLDLRS